MIVWDQVGDRKYENGLDRGVLYLSDGVGVPWNGLVSVTEIFNKNKSELFYDGQKVGDIIRPSNFSGTLKAFTYPDEFLEYDGFGNLAPGVFVGDQKSKQFGLSYRTHIGNDEVGNSAGYKLHVIYNLTATPSNVVHETHSNNLSLVEFEWTLSAIPEEYPGIRPTAHVIFDSRTIDPGILTRIENILYGDEINEASLPSFSGLLESSKLLIEIIDNEDGTWSAIATQDLISTDEFGIITIHNANLFSETLGGGYTISSTTTDML